MNSSNKKSGVGEIVSSILIAIGLALLIRTGVVQAFYIPSGSMEDTLLVGDYLLANKFVYGAPIDVPLTSISLFRLPALRDPQPGDIVIFRSPVDEERDLIKRCVAVGGQEVEIVDKELYVDGPPFKDPPKTIPITQISPDTQGWVNICVADAYTVRSVKIPSGNP